MTSRALYRAVFLDRDGTINEEASYLCRPEQLKIIPGSGPAIRRLKEQGFKVVVVTNQAGIAFGYFGEDDLQVIHESLKEKLSAFRANLDAIYYCPHHPRGTVPKYQGECSCRKPKTGLFFKAANELNIDLAASYVVGDKLSDIGAGKRLGCSTVLVQTGFGRRELSRGVPADLLPELVAADLGSALKYLV